VRVLAGHQSKPERHANGIRGTGIRKTHPAIRQRVDMGSLQIRFAITAKRLAAELIGEDEENIGLCHALSIKVLLGGAMMRTFPL
jgi:hypothetical protein